MIAIWNEAEATDQSLILRTDQRFKGQKLILQVVLVGQLCPLALLQKYGHGQAMLFMFVGFFGVWGVWGACVGVLKKI